MSTAPSPVSLAPTTALTEPVVPAQPGPSYFLLLPGIPGSATLAAFAGQIPLLTWGWGVDSSGSVLGPVGSGAGAGKPTPQEVAIRARTGIQSPKILAAVNTGHHLQNAVLSCVRPGDHPFTFLTLTFEDVLPSGYYVTPDAKDGFPVDQVRFKFAKVTQKVFTQNADGSAGQPVTTSFDYRTNSVA